MSIKRIHLSLFLASSTVITITLLLLSVAYLTSGCRKDAPFIIKMQESAGTIESVAYIPAGFRQPMKPLSETYKELGIAFDFPIEIKDANGRVTYYENSDDFWERRERDSKGNLTYYENSDGYWQKYERDDNGRPIYHEDSNGFWARWERNADGNMDYYENSDGKKEGTPRSANTCEGKVVEVDGIKYKLTAL